VGVKRTKFLVYVDKATMKDPQALFDAVMSHFIKKDLNIGWRKEFLTKFLKLSHYASEATQLEFIDGWVSVRNVETFPFRKRQEKAKGAADADQGAEGDVPVDDGADGEPESGAAPDGSDTLDGQDDDGDGREGD